MSNIYLHTQQGKGFHESKERLCTLFDVLAERETTYMLHFQTHKQIRATQDSQHEDCFAVGKSTLTNRLSGLDEASGREVLTDTPFEI